METRKIAIRLPQQLVQDMRGLAHRESLKRGRTVTWVQLLIEITERHLSRTVVRWDEQPV